jgi:integrase
MIKASETTERFTPGDIRRTVETRLSALGVSLDVRAQLQSHGLGGVQARHYDRHDYQDEKRAALVKLRELLTGKAATVTDITGRRRAKGAM